MKEDRTCGRCGKEFRYPSLLVRHNARKTPCVPVVGHPTAERPCVCPDCGRSFTLPSNLSHHRKLHCHGAKARATEPETELEVRMAALEARLGAKLDATLAELQAKPASAPVAVVTAGRDQIQSIDQSQNVHVHHHAAPPVSINVWGCEDTSHLKERLGQLLDSLRSGTTGKAVIAGVVGLIYSDPENPQNMTAYIPNKRDNIPHVRTEVGWEPRPEGEVYPAMVDRACNELQLKQDFELGYTPEGLVQLEARSEHVKSAFDAEKEAKAPKEAASFMRPVLQANKAHVQSLVKGK